MRKAHVSQRGAPCTLRRMPTPVAVLGAGSFGTCLSVLAAREHDVVLWARDPELSRAIEREHRNPRYLREVELPSPEALEADVAAAHDRGRAVALHCVTRAAPPALRAGASARAGRPLA